VLPFDIFVKTRLMRLYILLVFMLATLCCGAQNTNAQTLRLDASTIVKDSSGRTLAYSEWQPLLTTGYSLKPIEPKNPGAGYILFRLSNQQQAQSDASREEWIRNMPAPKPSPYFKTGDSFSPFKTRDMDGNKIDLKDLKGKIIVVNFWFVDCHPCRVEIPELNKLVDSFAIQDSVQFIGIALDDRSRLKDFLGKLPFHYDIIDNGKFFADKYGVHTYPTHVIIDQEGKVYFSTTGLAPNTLYWLQKSISELVAKQKEVKQG
jgi:peroxiredoxin